MSVLRAAHSLSRGTLRGTFTGHFWFVPSSMGQRTWCSSSLPVLIWGLGFFGPAWPKVKWKLPIASGKSLDTSAVVFLSEVQDGRKQPEVPPYAECVGVTALCCCSAQPRSALPHPEVLLFTPCSFAIPASAASTLWVALWQHAKLLQKLRPDVAL